jgi:ABC-type sugar transport system substrate-binding protein
MRFHSRDPRRALMRSSLALSFASAAVLLTACGAGSTGSAGANAGTGEFPSSGTVQFFGPSTENPYFGENVKGAQEVAQKHGWEVGHVESSSQEEQDAAVQQMLAQGEKPVGVILNPIAGEAAIATEQAIKAAGIPLVLLNQVPKEGQEDLYDAYAGVNDVGSGETAAKLLVEGAKAAGITLGDGLIVNTVAGHTAAQDRVAGFTAALAEGSPSSKTLDNVTSGGFLEAEGYNIGSQVIPANKGKFNWVYGVNDALAAGAIRAAKENGLTPGKDILFVGGTCMNANTNKAVLDGELVGTAVQSPWVEGASAMYAVAAYIKTGEVVDGEAELSADEPPSIDEPPHKKNYMPNPAVANNQESFDSTTVWGKPASELCNYG